MNPDSDNGRRVAAKAWCRVDLAGGTLDIWPLGLLHRGSRTVNVAIDLAVEVEMRRARKRYQVRQAESVVEADSAEALANKDGAALIGLVATHLELPPFELSIRSASPRGGGLGGSSALAVATIAAGEALIDHPQSSAHQRAALARDLEAVLMRLPTGRQDHFPALLGGAVEVLHEVGGERVRPIETDLEALGDSLVVVFSGQSHFSAGNNWRIVRNRLEGDSETIRCFEGISRAASGVVDALESRDLASVGALMSEEFRWRRRLAEGISTDRIDRILEMAGRAGAWGGKVCGAGGGGCLALLCPVEERQAVLEAIAEQGGSVLDTRPATQPLQLTIQDRGDR